MVHDSENPRQYYKSNNHTDTNIPEEKTEKERMKKSDEENKKKTKLLESFKSLFFFLINRLSYLRTKMQCNHKVSPELRLLG